jgi:ribosomal protein L37AE/L43A
MANMKPWATYECPKCKKTQKQRSGISVSHHCPKAPVHGSKMVDFKEVEE